VIADKHLFPSSFYYMKMPTTAPQGCNIMPFSLFVMSVIVVAVLCEIFCQTKAATFIFILGIHGKSPCLPMAIIMN